MTIPDIPDFPGTNLQDLNLDWLIDKMKTLDADFRAWPHSPKIENGNWYVWDTVLNDYVDTGVSATGAQGAQGPQGPQGAQGPQGPQGETRIISGVVNDGADLPNPAEHANELWLVATNLQGDLWCSTGSAWTYAGPLQGPRGPAGPAGPMGMTGAQGPQGIPGAPPIVRNGTWWVWDNTDLEYVDTGITAQGPQGPQGPPGQDGGDSIRSAIAPLEASYTASRAYAVGEFLFVGTKFYKVTQAIAEGGTITPGTNAVESTVEKQISELHEIKTGTYTDVSSLVTSVNEFRCKQIGKTVEIHFYVSGNFTTTSAQIDLLKCNGITPPPIPIRTTCGYGSGKSDINGLAWCLLWTNGGIGVRLAEATSTIFVDLIYTVD